MSERELSQTEKLKRAHADYLMRKKRGIEDAFSNGNGNGVGGHQDAMAVQSVPLFLIDLTDQRFQWRVSVNHGDLKKSIEKDGQQVPVVLWGESKPYKVIDGFRRLLCARDLGWSKIEAIVRDDITEEQAFKLSFIENVQRKNLSAVDRAHAIWHAMYKRGMNKEAIAEAFGISIRQVERYLAVVEYPEVLQAALLAGKITMGHAVVLSRIRGLDIHKVIERIQEENLSVPQVRNSLRKRVKSHEPRKYWQKHSDGFRVYAFSVSAKTSAAVKEKIRDSLREMLAYLDAMQ